MADTSKLLKESLLYYLPATSFFDIIISVISFTLKHRTIPNLSNPKTFNEQLLRIKIGRQSLDPLRQFISDKEYVKDYIRLMVGDQFNISTFDVLTDPEGVVDYPFPVRCVIKPTHMSSQIIIRRSHIDPIDSALIKGWFAKNYYRIWRERNYKYLIPKVIIEELLETNEGRIPNDYKVFCFHGKPMFIQVDFDRFKDHTRNFYTTRWEPLSFSLLYARNPVEEDRPDALEEMLSLAETLSERFNFIRVDFFAYGDTIKVGELTNFHGSCLERFTPYIADRIVGELFIKQDYKVLEPLILK